jgi:glutamyl-tRNA synthetase
MSGGSRGRLAPSPTGVLHLGNARSFLLAWLDARSRGGEILLRVEDLDGPRVRAGAEAEALADLRWLGLDWDGAVVRQSERAASYEDALVRLGAAGRAYPCTCTRGDVESAASAPHAGDEGPLYPGTCRGRWRDAAEAERTSGRTPCWRFLTPPPRDPAVIVEFVDRVRGAVRCDVGAELGDFVIHKRDGQAAYQLAVVVDDAAQGVTDVVRGDDLLPSAARQILLQRALGLPQPRYAHLPLVVGRDGRRLAKRHGDTSLRQFRAQGVPAEALVGWLAAVSGLQARAEPRRPADLVNDFSLARVPRSAVVWTGSLGV